MSTGQGLKDQHSMMQGAREEGRHHFCAAQASHSHRVRLRCILVMTRQGDHAARLGELFESRHVAGIAQDSAQILITWGTFLKPDDDGNGRRGGVF